MASRTGGSDDDADSDDDGAQSYSDDIHEMRAFMRMFMDLVGIFNDDEHLMEEGKLPGGLNNTFHVDLAYVCSRCVVWYDVWSSLGS